MKKLAAWFLLFLIASALPVLAFPAKDHWLYDLDLRMRKYDAEHPPCPVLVGPSYVAFLGEFGDIKNLGIHSARTKEILRVAASCKPDDLVIYPVSINDLAFLLDDARESITNPIFRRLFLSKIRAHEVLGLKGPALFRPYTGTIHNGHKKVIRQAADFMPVHMEYRIARHVDLYASLVQEPTIEPFRRLYEKHPNILYVLYPTFPIHAVSETSEFSAKVNKVVACSREFKASFLHSGLPVVDLSGSIPPEHFKDFVHLNEAGILQLRSLIRPYKNHPKTASAI
ncbi:hypothetical protein C4571_01890 [Candidatus Parcubacteria bacterium]|nr:MAG: hypothetical protein C4571_01890 [Candidatus Parcubacteria bacterium]